MVVCLALLSGNALAELDAGYERTKKVDGSCPSVKDQTDAWSFAACNCTSYVAYRLNLNGVPFTNTYDGNGKEDGKVSSWSDAKNWSSVAAVAGIRVDQYPAVGSVAQWNVDEIEGGHGHVAFVYKINVHGDGSLTSIGIAEYNGKGDGLYQTRTLTPGEDGYPGRFLHFEDKVNDYQPKATCVTSGARSLPGGWGPFCWVHGQYSALCEHATNWYYFDQQNSKFYTLASSSCPTSPTGGQGSGYGTMLNANALKSGSGGVEVFKPASSSGGKNPGDLPDLIVNDLYVVATEGDRTPLTQLRVNRTYFCALQIKNVGDAGAWDKFANRCYRSKGNWWDHDPDNLGHANMKELRSGQSRRVFIPIPPFKYPGRFNVTGDTDTDGGGNKAIAESDEGNNSHNEYQFDVVSSPNLVVSALTASAAEVEPNKPFTVTVTTKNAGESFGQDRQSTAVYVDGVLLSNHWRTRETLQGGMSETETVNVPGIAASGVHTLTACGDFNGLIPETDENDNCASISITVQPAYVPPGPNDPGKTVVSPLGSTPFSLSCGTLPADADFSTVPAVMDGDFASVIIGNNHQRMFLPQANLALAGGWDERLQSWVFIDPSQVSRVCWSSNESGLPLPF